MTISLFLKVVAIVLFLVNAFGLSAGRISLLSLGLAAWLIADTI